MKLSDEQIQSLAKFAVKVLEDWPDMGYLDGGDLQEMAVASNLLIPHIVHEPCGENCNCSEYYNDDEWQDGVTCYRVVDWLDRVAEQRDGADLAQQICPLCDGKKGYVVHGHGWTKCSRCNGRGHI